MAARDEKGKKREFGSGIRKTGCKQVPLEVVHAEHGHIERPADGVRNARACEQGAGKSGALRHGDGVDVSAFTSTSSTSATARRMWSRLASSGTTPP